MPSAAADTFGRTADHPADGFVRRGEDVYFYVQENVPHVVKDRGSRIVRYKVSAANLAAFTAEAKRGLGCG